MYTSNCLMNHSNYNDIFSQTPKENHDKSEWMECPNNKMECSLDNVVELKTDFEISTLTHIDCLKQTCLGTDNINDMQTVYRDGGLTLGDGMPKWIDDLISGTGKKTDGLPPGGKTLYALPPGGGKKPDGLPPGGGKKPHGLPPGGGKKPDGLPPGGGKKETDNNDKDITKKIGNAAKNISQSVITNIVSESLCSIIDSSREKGFQNTDIPKILTNAVGSSMKTIKGECLKGSTSFLSEWLTTVAPQLKCVAKPLKKIFIIWDFISVTRDWFASRMTLWQLVKWFFSKAVCFGFQLLISSIFGPVGCAFEILISIFKKVITHLIKRS